jgi:hypothetical protein
MRQQARLVKLERAVKPPAAAQVLPVAWPVLQRRALVRIAEVKSKPESERTAQDFYILSFDGRLEDDD